MKKIEAIIKPHKLDDVKDALAKAGAKAVRQLADVDGVVYFEAK